MAIAPTPNRPLPDEEVFYPDGDGEPMAESDVHWNASNHCVTVIKEHVSRRNNVYVAGNNFLYYMRGRPKSVVSPDCYVVFGVDPRPQLSYKTWENGDKLPVFVLEITSSSTRNEDTGRKFWLYQDTLGVDEYFQFDPTADYITTQLRGYRLSAAGYAPLTPDVEGRLYSETLGLFLIPEGEYLRFYDPIRGIRYPTYPEAREQGMRAEAERLRAEQEKQRAEQAEQRANQATQRAETLEAELIQAHARLEELQRQIQEATLLQSGAGAAVKEQNDTFEN